jgi:hypothetical protein
MEIEVLRYRSEREREREFSNKGRFFLQEIFLSFLVILRKSTLKKKEKEDRIFWMTFTSFSTHRSDNSCLYVLFIFGTLAVAQNIWKFKMKISLPLGSPNHTLSHYFTLIISFSLYYL